MISDEIMAEIDLALDDIISKQKPMNRQNNGKRRSQGIDEPLTSFRGGGLSKRGFGGGASRGSFGGDGRIRFPVNKSRIGQNDVVWINIANLPESVVTDDLKELFQDFSVQGLGVHYDEFGQHMGTADLFVDSRSAKAILREFANIAIDGQRIRFAIVNEQAADTPQFQTHQRRAGGRQPIRPRPRFNRPNAFDKRGGGRSDSQQSTRTYSRSRSPLNRRAAGVFKKNNPPRNQRKNSAATRQEMKSTDELDRELEAYMKGNKHPRIKLDE